MQLTNLCFAIMIPKIWSRMYFYKYAGEKGIITAAKGQSSTFSASPETWFESTSERKKNRRKVYLLIRLTVSFQDIMYGKAPIQRARLLSSNSGKSLKLYRPGCRPKPVKLSDWDLSKVSARKRPPKKPDARLLLFINGWKEQSKSCTKYVWTKGDFTFPKPAAHTKKIFFS